MYIVGLRKCSEAGYLILKGCSLYLCLRLRVLLFFHLQWSGKLVSPKLWSARQWAQWQFQSVMRRCIKWSQNNGNGSSENNQQNNAANLTFSQHYFASCDKAKGFETVSRSFWQNSEDLNPFRDFVVPTSLLLPAVLYMNHIVCIYGIE